MASHPIRSLQFLTCPHPKDMSWTCLGQFQLRMSLLTFKTILGFMGVENSTQDINGVWRGRISKKNSNGKNYA